MYLQEVWCGGWVGGWVWGVGGVVLGVVCVWVVHSRASLPLGTGTQTGWWFHHSRGLCAEARLAGSPGARPGLQRLQRTDGRARPTFRHLFDPKCRGKKGTAVSATTLTCT